MKMLVGKGIKRESTIRQRDREIVKRDREIVKQGIRDKAKQCFERLAELEADMVDMAEWLIESQTDPLFDKRITIFVECSWERDSLHVRMYELVMEGRGYDIYDLADLCGAIAPWRDVFGAMQGIRWLRKYCDQPEDINEVEFDRWLGLIGGSDTNEKQQQPSTQPALFTGTEKQEQT